MSKYSQGKFYPKNPKKLIGRQDITFRSSWELTMMRFLDEHPGVIQWASESIKIPYHNPVKKCQSLYIPDFLILFQDKYGRRRVELVEVKPKKEALMENAKSNRDKLALVVNPAQWAAASAWAKRNGMSFTVITEDNIYRR